MSFVLEVAEQITEEVDALIFELRPDVGRRAMYGGVVFELEAGNPKTMVCGHFIYKAHVSVEFSEGHALKDPEKLLEGKGKFRRHLKLHSLEDIQNKKLANFLTQIL
ncbi:MAG: DUF1801 domain-containing protein [Pseudomonadota bacterium]